MSGGLWETGNGVEGERGSMTVIGDERLELPVQQKTGNPDRDGSGRWRETGNSGAKGVRCSIRDGLGLYPECSAGSSVRGMPALMGLCIVGELIKWS